MKALLTVALGLFLTTGLFANEQTNQSDQKWRSVVAQMIAEGPTTISTPEPRRVEIAKQLAKAAGRNYKVAKAYSKDRVNYRITIK